MAEIIVPLMLSGPAIAPESYPIQDVNEIVLDLALLLKRSVDRQLLHLQIEANEAPYEILGSFPKYGSFEQQLIIHLKEFANNHPVAVAMSLLVTNINQVFSLYDHIKKRLPKKPRVEEAHGSDIVIGGAPEPLRVNSSMFDKLVNEPEFRNILERLSPARVESLEIGKGTNRIKITGNAQDRDVWRTIRKLKKQVDKLEYRHLPLERSILAEDAPNRVFNHLVEVTGTIRAVDLDARTGRVRVDPGAEVPPGGYAFHLLPAADEEQLRNHVGGRVKLQIHSIAIQRPGNKTTLFISRINRLSLPSGRNAT